MADPVELENDAVSFARNAVDCDKEMKYDQALFYYTEAVQALISAAMAGSHHGNLVEKAHQYMDRANEIKNMLESSKLQTQIQSENQVNTERAQYLLHEAFELDDDGNKEEAIEAYLQAAELLIKLLSSTSDKQQKSKMESLAKKAMDRVEYLKTGSITTPPEPTKPLSHSTPSSSSGRAIPPLGFRPFADESSSSASAPSIAQKPKTQVPTPRAALGDGYTKEEIAVLRRTSDINGRQYLPFLDIDARERFAFPIPFTDKDGILKLSNDQQRRLHKWVRPQEFMEDPKMILIVSPMSIKQTLVQDCSFVASMAISAQYERLYKRKLVTNIIYPQNRNGEAIYNPCGKYMVKLNINGVPRKVIIDDYLPISYDGQLLCSYSVNKNELWVSLLEKAYMKVMGGYDFPGSNSNIDLHALTGWIPERIAIRKDSLKFNKDKEFRKLHERFHKGHCLVTVATGELSKVDEERSGLAPTHAYAMLDIREVEGKRFFMLKNPWSHMRWKGNYSENDTKNWTPSLQKVLNYDMAAAKLHDNGVFWIDYDSLCHFYDVIYVNWNPDLFPKRTCYQNTWLAREGPKRDMYNISDNPQYRLEVNATGPCPVWILLTRHITDKADFANNREFIALVIYKDVPTQRVYYPNDPQPFKDSPRINSPHTLVKLEQEKGRHVYHVVVSQYEKNNTIHYTLRVYSTCDFKLTRIVEPYRTNKTVTGNWKGISAGGCRNNVETYENNPTFQLKLDNNNVDNEVLLELKAPREFFVGFDIVTVSANNSTAAGNFQTTSSGSFRQGYVILELHNISGGVYNITPSTHRPRQEGPFILVVSSMRPFTISQIK